MENNEFNNDQLSNSGQKYKLDIDSMVQSNNQLVSTDEPAIENVQLTETEHQKGISFSEAPVKPVVENLQPIETVQQNGISFSEAPVKTILKNEQGASEETDIKTSGTATEDELIIDASKPSVEVIDEYVIKKDLANEKNKEKHNTMFVIIFFLFIIGFIIALPFIKKMIGI